ncbi:GMC oxidoreductase [Actinospongicola halichondriae]|uniref:GMC oxidoreductase n=1 Tax=Actinospongicola halichondriae TaxID=3236844 RepID=UPI003D42943D
MATFDDETRRRVAAVFDRLIPADDHPAVSGAGLFEHLERLAADEHTVTLTERALELVDVLDDRARTTFGAGVDDLAVSDLDALISGLEWDERESLVQRAAEAYYGGADTPGARMIGYDARPRRSPGAPIEPPVVPATALADCDDRYDVVVLGAGAGGGVAAWTLAEAGARVLLVERGRALSFDDVGRDHLRNHRSSVHGNNTGPAEDGNPREWVDRRGQVVSVELPHDPRWNNNAMTVGGGSRVYQGMAWRFAPDDFAMASTYGVPDGSSLADWPIAYDDLESFYTWVEHDLGVCGDGTAHPASGPRSSGYPMPPLPTNTEAAVLGAGARRLGLRTGPVPLLINSEPRNGAARCVQCGECVGFACPSGAKNGTYDTAIPRALATGNAHLVTGTRAVEIVVDDDGSVRGARLVDEGTGRERTVHAGDVVVACGAIETARLLLDSRSSRHPDGLGNAHDQVGRHLQGHSFVSVFGRFDEPVLDLVGPGVSIATVDHLHGNDGVIGGGVIANEIVKLPIVHWRWAYQPDAPRWGLGAKVEMRDGYRTTSHLFGQVQEIPRADNRVQLGERTDALGVRVARLQGAAHEETIRAARHIRGVAREWMEASGAHTVWSDAIPTGLTAGQHQAGTCRMGVDPTSSVTDPDGRVHGHDNLWVADGSLHVNNGGVNPVLTIYALARRTATILAATR